MDIIVFDPDYTALGMLVAPVSILYTERAQQRGDFEIQLPLNSSNVELAKEDRVLLLDAEKGIAGVISIVKKQNSNSEPTLQLKGYCVKNYLFTRICWGLCTYTGSPESIANQMVTEQIIQPQDPNRAIPDIQIQEQTLTEKSIVFQTTGDLVGANVEKLCTSHSLNYAMIYKPFEKRMLFKLFKGTDRTKSQRVVPQCIFSSSFENLLDSSYIQNVQNSKNVFFVAGEGEGAERKHIVLGEAAGKQRREQYIDARDLQSVNSDGMQMPEEEYMQLLVQRGEEKKADYKESESFDCVINPQGNIQYGVDFFLGDIVTISDSQLGIEIDAVISEAQHSYTKDGYSLELTLGFRPWTIDQIMKAKVSN